MRNSQGNPAIFFVALITVTAVIILGISNFSKFMLVNSKINHALEEAETVILNEIKNNLSEDIVIRDPDAAALVLENAKSTAAAVVIDSLHEKTKEFLLAHNNNDLSESLDLSTLTANSDGSINIQLIFRANLGNSIFNNYQKKGRKLKVKPSEIQSSSKIDFNCDNCRACSFCNPNTGQCVQGPRKLINSFGQYVDPSNGTNPSGGFDCRSFYNSAQGSFCKEKMIPVNEGGEGWLSFTDSGAFGCQSDPNQGEAQCFFIDNHSSWNLVRASQAGGPKAILRFNGNIITEMDINATQVSTPGQALENNFRGERNPYAVNLDDPHGDVYSVCNADISLL